jgi:ribonuclease BN (tRNA processing enzyme)
MKITILGSGTATPRSDRGSPGIAVRSEDTLLLLDLGAGTLYRAARFGVDLNRVDGVLLTHLHPDHTGDLVSLLFAFHGSEWSREDSLTVYGPPGLAAFFRNLELTYDRWIAAKGYTLAIEVLDAGPKSLKNVRLRACPVPHGPPAVAYEITDASGRRLVYSGDTGYCDELADFARGAELLILECSFPEGEGRPGHLTPSEAGRMADRAGCGRLLLTHFYPACEGHDLVTPCQRFYDGPITLAHDGLSIEL